MEKLTKAFDSLKKIGKEIAKEKGAPVFFGALLPVRMPTEDPDTDSLIQNRFDLIVSGNWGRKLSERKLREFIFQKLIDNFKREELINFVNHLIVLTPDQEFIKQITKKIGYVAGDVYEVYALPVGRKGKELMIERAVVIYSLPKGKIETSQKNKVASVSSVTIGDNPNALGKVKPKKKSRQRHSKSGR